MIVFKYPRFFFQIHFELNFWRAWETNSFLLFWPNLRTFFETLFYYTKVFLVLKIILKKILGTTFKTTVVTHQCIQYLFILIPNLKALGQRKLWSTVAHNLFASKIQDGATFSIETY